MSDDWLRSDMVLLLYESVGLGNYFVVNYSLLCVTTFDIATSARVPSRDNSGSVRGLGKRHGLSTCALSCDAMQITSLARSLRIVAERY